MSPVKGPKVESTGRWMLSNPFKVRFYAYMCFLRTEPGELKAPGGTRGGEEGDGRLTPVTFQTSPGLDSKLVSLEHWKVSVVRPF